jgi:hypothetical protein
MGRVMVPVSFLNHESLCGWFPLGRTTTRDAQFTGEIYLELRIKSQLVRHAIQHSRTDEMYLSHLTKSNNSVIVHYSSFQPITRWNADDQLHKHCDEITDFRLPIQCPSTVLSFPGREFFLLSTVKLLLAIISYIVVN